MKKLLISLLVLFLISSCTPSLLVEEFGDGFKENVEVFFAITEVTVSNNGLQRVVEVSLSAKENDETLSPEDSLEDGYFVFVANEESLLELSVSNLPDGFRVIWKDDLGEILGEGTAYKFNLLDLEAAIHVFILNSNGNVENALKFKVISSEVCL